MTDKTGKSTDSTGDAPADHASAQGDSAPGGQGRAAMDPVTQLATEMAARHLKDRDDMRARFLEECRALGLDPDTQKITPLMYALAVAGGGGGRTRKMPKK